AFPFFMPHFDFPAISSMAITPDGMQLGVCVESQYLPATIALWSLAEATRSVRLFSGPRVERFGPHAFSRDGKFMAAGYRRRNADGTSIPLQPTEHRSGGVFVWRLDTGQVEQDLSSDLGGAGGYLSFSPDGKLLACPCEEGVALFETSRFQRL